MGVLKDIITDSGVEVNNAYFRIGSLSGTKEKIEFSLLSYVNRNAWLEGKASLSVEDKSFVPNIDDQATNFFRQAYASLKENAEFREAEDVLEAGQAPII